MTVRVCFHDQCFDGACSAAVFTRFYHECIAPSAEIRYHGLTHRAGQLFEGDIFDGDENVIVDYVGRPSKNCRPDMYELTDEKESGWMGWRRVKGDANVVWPQGVRNTGGP
jgi:hypothetical protein